ncbi:transposase [Burkholderia pseudomallei]|nr:transposase [Burkholderia pseudomallei]CAJ4429972.1 transposase [Burkholderia pseudomallei]CAJ5672569.1 transposase [Burkholderia pseudomallei]CAJ6939799.1 transposase [Burkholderia pseudomallei]CAJ6943349.1 transposase [Burkholderia pseudomallei]
MRVAGAGAKSEERRAGSREQGARGKAKGKRQKAKGKRQKAKGSPGWARELTGARPRPCVAALASLVQSACGRARRPACRPLPGGRAQTDLAGAAQRRGQVDRLPARLEERDDAVRTAAVRTALPGTIQHGSPNLNPPHARNSGYLRAARIACRFRGPVRGCALRLGRRCCARRVLPFRRYGGARRAAHCRVARRRIDGAPPNRTDERAYRATERYTRDAAIGLAFHFPRCRAGPRIRQASGAHRNPPRSGIRRAAPSAAARLPSVNARRNPAGSCSFRAGCARRARTRARHRENRACA